MHTRRTTSSLQLAPQICLQYPLWEQVTCSQLPPCLWRERGALPWAPCWFCPAPPAAASVVESLPIRYEGNNWARYAQAFQLLGGHSSLLKEELYVSRGGFNSMKDPAQRSPEVPWTILPKGNPRPSSELQHHPLQQGSIKQLISSPIKWRT